MKRAPPLMNVSGGVDRYARRGALVQYGLSVVASATLRARKPLVVARRGAGASTLARVAVETERGCGLFLRAGFAGAGSVLLAIVGA